MRQSTENQSEKANQSRMFLLNYIDSEIKTNEKSTVYFNPKDSTVISNCKIHFTETYMFNKETNTIDCIVNTIDHIELSTSSFNTLPSLSSITNSIIVKEDDFLKHYCLMLKDPNTKGKRRKKRASLTSLIEKSSVEEIKNKLKLRRKANSVCFNNNNEK